MRTFIRKKQLNNNQQETIRKDTVTSQYKPNIKCISNSTNNRTVRTKTEIIT